MRVFIRADASTEMGAGHAMRCLALSEELRNRGASVAFICREHPGDLSNYIEKKGFPVHRLPLDVSWTPAAGGNKLAAHAGWLGTSWDIDAAQAEAILAREREHGPIDWLVVDHYALDARWERRMRSYVKKIMTIDDLADRPHDCDLLLDQNLYRDMDTRYSGLVPQHCQKLLGPRYALLRREFREARQDLRERTGEVNRILVFFAGADWTNETAKALQGIQLLNDPKIAVDVVVAAIHLYKEQIQQLVEAMPNATFYCQPENLLELMAEADLSVGGSGSTTWERCCLGLPTLVIPLAANQQAVARDLTEHGAVFSNWSRDNLQLQIEDYRNSLQFLMGNPASLMRSSSRARDLVDGQGVSRCVSVLQVDHLAAQNQQYPCSADFK